MHQRESRLRPAEPTEAWLRATEERCRAEAIEPGGRAWFALMAYAGQHQVTLTRDDPVAQRIFGWFREHSR